MSPHKSQLSPRKWSLKTHFNSFVVMFMAFIIILSISLTAKSANRWQEDPVAATAAGKNSESCDLFSGRWVYDNATYPLYTEKKCTFMSDQSACQKFGRKDTRYQNWRWQPHGCNLPRYQKLYLVILHFWVIIHE